MIRTNLLLVLILACRFPLYADKNSTTVDTAGINITLPLPKLNTELNYLGLSEEFDLKQLKAEVVIIEIFSMYCPYCQKEAPKVNRLFTMINDSLPGDKIKIIGLGVNNSDFEVKTFKMKYQVPFPLFADPDGTNSKLLGAEVTPTFLVFLTDKGKIVHRTVKTLSGPGEFLKIIMEKTDLEKGKK